MDNQKALMVMPSIDELNKLGNIFVQSGFFADTRQAAQAVTKILAGREMGFGPITSMTNIYIVSGRPALSANLVASRIKSSGRYDYRVKKMDATICELEFFETIDGKRESIGVSTFTLEDAKKAGTKNLEKFPRNMLFARAMTNGARWFCPDVFGGAVYTPEELGATVEMDGEGNVVKVIDPNAPPEPAKATRDEFIAKATELEFDHTAANNVAADHRDPVTGKFDWNGAIADLSRIQTEREIANRVGEPEAKAAK